MNKKFLSRRNTFYIRGTIDPAILMVREDQMYSAK